MLSGCSQYSSSPGSVAFHNLTAKYNAYYIARFETELAERAMHKAYQDNYNQILPILMPLDSTLGISVRPQLENAIKKASIVAEKHQNSKWLDDSYTLIGKDRLYLGQYDDGVEALRYVFANGRDEDDKNTALIWLMRAYTQKGDYDNALDVAEYLRQQPLTKEATRDFYLAKAAVHQQQGEYLTAVAILEQAFPLLKRSPEKARLHYVAGQLYDRIGQYALAADHYRDVARNRPTYDLSFYAGMNSLQNRVLLDPKVDLTDVGFDKMLRDRKNNDLRDRIYYTMGLLAERRGRYPEAVGFLQKSVQVARANPEQIPYTYLELARINYDRLEDYETAQAYYDSALVTLPQQAEQYRIVSDRKKALDEFVTQISIVRTEDSLQALAQMNPAALERKLDAIIEEQEEEKRQLLLKAQEALAASNRPSASDIGTPFISGSERRWELYDPVMVNQGRVEFRRLWGNRPLEDNWRRANKENASFTASAQNPNLNAAVVPPENDLGLKAETTLAKGSEAWVTRRNGLLKNVPISEAAFSTSEKREEDALYRLGKIYRFDLKEPEKAVTTFTRLLKDFPKTAYREEIYYLIYLSLDENNKNRPLWKEKLLAEFPNSSYARLLNQAQLAQDDKGGTLGGGFAAKTYDSIYKLYTAGNYSEALAQVENALAQYRENPLVDKFALLRIFLVGKVRGRDAYLQAINEFIRLYPDSSLLPRVQEMLEVTGRASTRR
ncbi:tetratricopeptide repeat protein [Cytophagaceae bacterium SJW1-29]|uniref:Tetratricopeptide repeat protein n=2 Tax=Salmonirosea aquatica TaxID=2654236 RepID=A0A7C9F517_9BACT|nr:tetratricopeptide repeat protein [Cytophagaceae bacterium SJW1-29]